MELGGLKQPYNNVAPRGPISLDEAVAVFGQLADMEDLAFDQPRNGCEARAHLMCGRLVKMNLTPQKAWAFEGKRTLRPPLKKCFRKKGEGWCCHVAPALPVRMPDGTVQDMVMDPALFDSPVSLQEWGDLMKAQPELMQMTPLGVAPRGQLADGTPLGDYFGACNTDGETDYKAQEDILEYKQYSNGKRRRVFPSQTCLQLQQTHSQQGKTWRTISVTPLPPMSPKQPAIVS